MILIFEIIIFIIFAIFILIYLKKTPQIKNISFDFLENKKSQFKNNFKKIDHKEQKIDKKDKKFNNLLFFSNDKNANKEYILFENAEQFFIDKNYIEAEKIYIKIASINPKNLKVYNRLGVIYMENKNFKDAKESFGLAVKLDPKKASRHYNYALACLELKEYRNAIDSIRTAIKLDNKNSKYKIVLTELKNKLNYRYEEAKRKER